MGFDFGQFRGTRGAKIKNLFESLYQSCFEKSNIKDDTIVVNLKKSWYSHVGLPKGLKRFGKGKISMKCKEFNDSRPALTLV